MATRFVWDGAAAAAAAAAEVVAAAAAAEATAAAAVTVPAPEPASDDCLMAFYTDPPPASWSERPSLYNCG